MKGSRLTGEPQSGAPARAGVQTLIPLLSKNTAGLLRTPFSQELCAGQMTEEEKHQCNFKRYRGNPQEVGAGEL